MNDGGHSILALREQLSNLCSLFTLSMVMSDGRGEPQIVELAASSVASLTSCRPVASLLTRDSEGLRSPDGTPLDWPQLTARLTDLDGADGPITETGSA